MSWPASNTNRGRLIPLTWRGTFFAVVSLTVLAFGIVRIELAALLWGSGFFLLTVYALAGNHLNRWQIRKHLASRLEAVDCTLPSRGLFPDDIISAAADSSALVKVEMPSRGLPGLRAHFLLKLVWQDRRPICLETRLYPGLNERRLELRAEKRGLYKSRRAELVVTDLLGFSRSVLEVPLTEQVRVLPPSRPAAEVDDPGRQGGEEVEKVVKLRRSEELLEVRKYFPGDDLRKINWKLYAHLDDLFVRLGEETPPPESRFLVLLDSSPAPALPPELASDYLDSLVEACAAFSNMLLLRGVQLTFTRCGGRELKTFGLESRQELLAGMAEVWWSPAENLPLPARKAMQALVFSSPASGGLEGILKTLRSRGWGVSLYLKRLDYPERADAVDFWKNLVFRPREAASPPRAGLKREVEAFNLSLKEARSRYRRAPWRVSHVEEV
jgi:uncharacterized protein (DUF58 family)